jgi:hypothetical protein
MRKDMREIVKSPSCIVSGSPERAADAAAVSLHITVECIYIRIIQLYIHGYSQQYGNGPLSQQLAHNVALASKRTTTTTTSLDWGRDEKIGARPMDLCGE